MQFKRKKWIDGSASNEAVLQPRIVLRLDNENLTYESVAKLPILGKKNLLGIVTYGSNLTPGLSLRSLFFLYERMFPKKNAIERFLRHVGIDSYFFLPLTRSDVLVLIERSHAKSNMEIAAQHKVIVRTVETHMANVRLKLKGDVLPTVLAQLRGRNEVKVDDLIGIESDRNDRMPSLPIDAKVRARKPDR